MFRKCKKLRFITRNWNHINYKLNSFQDEDQDPNDQQDQQHVLLDNELNELTTEQQKQQQKDYKGTLQHINNIQEGTIYHAYVCFVTENTGLVEVLMLLPLFLMVMYIVFIEQGPLFRVIEENID